MAVYPEKRKGKFTGVWIAEAFVNGARVGRERFSSQKDAERWHDYMKVTGAPPPESGKPKEHIGPTVKQVANEALREHEAWENGRDPGIGRMVDYIVRTWGEDTDIGRIDETHLSKLVKSLKNRPGYQGRERLRPGRINRYLAAASVLLHFAKRKKYRADVPSLEGIRQKDDGKRIHFLTEPEEANVRRAMLAEGSALGPVAADTTFVLCRTGLRWGEFERLKPADIVGNWVKLDKTKTDTPRDVPVAEQVANTLRRLVEQGQIKRQAFRECLIRALKSAGENPAITPHSLRHTAATRLVLAGFPLAKVQKFMGHRDIKTTMKYVHVQPRDLEDAATILSCTAGETAKPDEKTAIVSTNECVAKNALSEWR